MDKYLTIINVFWQRALTYRFTVLAYRVGEILELVVLIVMWTAIFQHTNLVSGFSLKEMVTYLLIGNIFRAMIRNFLSDIVAYDIKEGRLSLSLIRPMGYFTYVVTREIGRISLVFFLSVVTQLLICLLFLNNFIFNLDLRYLGIILIMLVLAFFTELLMSYLIGTIAFWTDEVDGLITTINSLKRFFSGGYFPLSLLPAAFVTASFLLPFAYSFYIPTQLYLKKIDLSLGVQGLLVQVGWIVTLLLIINIVWKRGLKRYEGVGI